MSYQAVLNRGAVFDGSRGLQSTVLIAESPRRGATPETAPTRFNRRSATTIRFPETVD
jgi:hypothetical protein